MNKDEMIEMLKQFKTKEAQLKLKEIDFKKKTIELNKIMEEEYSINITPKYTEGSKSNEISSKVENAVIRKSAKIIELEEELKKLQEEIDVLKLDVEEINVRLGTLSYIEKEVLTDYYVNENKLEDIGNFTYYRLRQQTRSAKTIKRLIENAVNKLAKI